MICNDAELKQAQERIAFFETTVARMRITCTPAEFPHVSRAWLKEVDKMHREIMEYLSRHAAEPAGAHIS